MEVQASTPRCIRLGPDAWKAAFSIAASLLRGVHQHLPRVVRSAEFAEGADCQPHYSKLPSRGKDVLATLCVKLSQKEVYGEIATRSRIGACLRLGDEVIFAVIRPPPDLAKAPLLMEVHGFDFLVLPEITKLRRHLKQVLGSDYSRKSTTVWYEKHKDEFCPLQDSKLRRILASIFEQHSLIMLPEWALSRTIWGMLNIFTQSYRTFEFWDEGRSGIRLTVRGTSMPEDEEYRQQLVCIVHGFALRFHAGGAQT
ncbi:unnamed protein product [Effrenium voratum]|uniref:Uncharacterized protein n=1 Tax=Effrenium voratum TaxID=2562239 RepID=A0AA36MSP7_9DINO|nr:unnamed protein product [Effrenium voratum]CAJ1460987.1 unnamed protein product [Effrenium voratum]